MKLKLTLVNRAEVRGRKRRRIQEEEELFTSSIVQVVGLLVTFYNVFLSLFHFLVIAQ